MMGEKLDNNKLLLSISSMAAKQIAMLPACKSIGIDMYTIGAGVQDVEAAIRVRVGFPLAKSTFFVKIRVVSASSSNVDSIMAVSDAIVGERHSLITDALMERVVVVNMDVPTPISVSLRGFSPRDPCMVFTYDGTEIAAELIEQMIWGMIYPAIESRLRRKPRK